MFSTFSGPPDRATPTRESWQIGYFYDVEGNGKKWPRAGQASDFVNPKVGSSNLSERATLPRATADAMLPSSDSWMSSRSVKRHRL